jgi:hypothetical protein
MMVRTSPRKKSDSPLLKLCICLVRPKTIKKADEPVARGHGLGSTI